MLSRQSCAGHWEMAVLNGYERQGPPVQVETFSWLRRADREGPALRYLSTVIVASHRTGSVGSWLTQVRRTSSVLVAVMVWLN